MRTIWKVLFLTLLLALCAVCAAEGGVVVIPDSTAAIEAEAFLNADMTEVVLPEGIRMIGSRAFANCSDLERINLPGTLQSIAPDAFDGCDDLVASIPIGGRIQDWCINAGIAYECDPAEVLILRVSDPYIVVDEGILEVSVRTTPVVDTLALYDENGSLVASWDRGASGMHNEAREWYFEEPIFNAGIGVIDAQWSFVASAGNTLSAPAAIDVFYDPNADQLVSNFFLQLEEWETYHAGDWIAFIASRAQDFDYFKIVDQNGNVVYETDEFAEYVDEYDDYMSDFTLDEPGAYTLTAMGSRDGQTWYACSRKCAITIAEGEAVYELYFYPDPYVRTGEPFDLYYELYGGSVEAIGLFENGRLLTSWDYDEGEGMGRWTYTAEGQHTLTLKYSLDGETWEEPGATGAVTVTGMPFVYGGGQSGRCEAGGSEVEIEYWIHTTDDAAYLALFDPEGGIVGVLAAADAAEPGEDEYEGTRWLEWSGRIPVTVDEIGRYDYSLAASADGTHYGPHTPYELTVTPQPPRDGVRDAYCTSTDGLDAAFTVTTSRAATAVRATDPNGNAYVFSITDDPEEVEYDEEELEWPVLCTFPARGHYPVVFQATTDGANWGAPYVTVADVDVSGGNDTAISVYGFDKAYDTMVVGYLNYNFYDEEGGSEHDIVPDIAAVRLYDADGAMLCGWTSEELTFELDRERYSSNSNVLSYDFCAPGIYFYSVEVEMADGASWREYYCVDAAEGTGELAEYRRLTAVKALFGDLRWAQVPVTSQIDWRETVPGYALTPRETPGRFYVFANTEPIDFALWGESDMSILGMRLGMTREEIMAAALANGAELNAEFNDGTLVFTSRDFHEIYVHFEDGAVSHMDTFTYSEV